MIRCIIVDDEPLSRKVIQKYLRDLPHVELVASCNNAFEAMEILKNEAIALLFLDINMPRLSGINFAKTLSNPPLIIFTTAYPEYAVEGFELDAVDYLLKPFSFERFLKAFNKAAKLLENNKPGHEPERGALILKADKKLYKLDFKDILYLQAFGDYVKVFTNGKTLLTKDRLANLEEKLPDDLFLRIHRSYIISLAEIKYVEGNQVKIREELLPVSETYRKKLLERFQDLKR